MEGLALFLAVVERAAAFLLLAGTAAGVLAFLIEDLERGVATFLAADLRRGFIALLGLGVEELSFFPPVAGAREMDLRLEAVEGVLVPFFTLFRADFFIPDFLTEERSVFLAAGVPLLLPMEERFPKEEAAAPLGVAAFLLAEAAGFLLPEEEARGMGSEVVALAEPFQGERKPSTCVCVGWREGGREGRRGG